MRDIKFRGLDFDNNWRYGYIWEDKNGWYIFEHEGGIEVKKETFGQYTGLKDKNGTEIYEGDIIATDLSRKYNIVVYRNCAFMLNCNDGGDDNYDYFGSIDEKPKLICPYSEVIGNIHDNPELLQEKECQ